MKSDLREIELLDGQALFEVAHDEARPFIVRSGGIGVRAVGTQFDVNQRHSGTVVTVVEGRVQVGTALHESQPVTPEREPQLSQDRPTRQDQLFISAGEQIRVAQNGAIVRTQTVDTAAAISWLRQELRFDGQPLSDVLEEFNRYTRTPLVLTDASLADFRINAVFHTTNPDALLKFVARIDNVQIERTGKEIRISRRE
jgi:transmembrane sensor